MLYHSLMKNHIFISMKIKARDQEMAYQALALGPLLLPDINYFSSPTHSALLSPPHSALVRLTSLLFLECIRQVLALEDLHWLFSASNAFPYFLYSSFPPQFGIFLQVNWLSLDTQSKSAKFPHSTLILLPPLCFFPCKSFCHLPSHILLTFPVHFLPPSTRIKRQGFCSL